MRVDTTTRALVTGAGKGIGKAIADALTARGATAGVGGLDLVVADAGIAHYGPFAEQDPALQLRRLRGESVAPRRG